MALIPSEQESLFTEDITCYLSSLTWASGATSGAKYYASTEFSHTGKKVVSIAINGFGSIRATDMLIPYIQSDGGVGIMSNVDSFQNNNSRIGLRISYFKS